QIGRVLLTTETQRHRERETACQHSRFSVFELASVPLCLCGSPGLRVWRKTWESALRRAVKLHRSLQRSISPKSIHGTGINKARNVVGKKGFRPDKACGRLG